MATKHDGEIRGKYGPAKPGDKRLGNSFSPGMPRKIKSTRQLKQGINAYFNSITKEIIETDDNGEVVSKYETYLKPPTLQSLALSMNVTHKCLHELVTKTARNDEDFQDYVELYELAKARCEAFLVESASDRKTYVKGQEFLLKNNYGFVDKQVIEDSNNNDSDKLDYSKYSPEKLEELKELLKIGMSSDE